jgi:dipeptidyl aminopeptidase/acylaminoacyl peptidase
MSPFRRSSLLAALALPLATLAGSAFAQQAAAPKLAIDRYLEMESVANPRLSPDGTQVVFTRTWLDKVNDRPASELWIVGRDGSRLRQLTEGNSPQWSPDCRRNAFLRDGRPSGTQIHVLWVESREVSQITHVTEAPSALQWSPDGLRIAFQMLVAEKPSNLTIKLPAKPDGAKWAEEPSVITRLNYRRDQSGYRPQGFDHLFVVDADGGTPRQVTSGDFDHRAGRWSADGTKLWFSGLRADDADWRDDFESDLYTVDVESGAIADVTNHPGAEVNPTPSPDGRHVVYAERPDHFVERNTYDVTSLRVMDADGRNVTPLAPGLDRDPFDLEWAKDSSGVFFTLDSEGTRNVWFADLAGGKPKKITSGGQRITSIDVAADGTLVGVVTSPHVPSDLVLISTKEGEAGALTTLTPITHVNDDVLGRVALGAVEEFDFMSADGFDVEGWIVKPPDFDATKKYPLILQIHGGPHGMYGFEWSFERQLHAAEGFVVLYVNPRGSTGYGQNFGNAIKNDYPDKDYDDLMRGVDEVSKRGFVDEKNLFVYGGSGGGVLTAWIVGHTDRFRAAVSMFPVIDWISFVGTTDGPYWYENFKKLPWEDVTEHWNRSPLKYVGNVKTPTLLITGELDLRTPMAQTEEFYQALKFRHVETAMIRVPDEYHGAANRHPSNAMRRILYVQQWFKNHMTGAAPAGAGATSGS